MTERIKLEVYLDLPQNWSATSTAKHLHSLLHPHLHPVVRVAAKGRESNSNVSLESFAKTVLENTCGKEIRDSEDPGKVVYNATDIPGPRQEVLYIYDLHCKEALVWVKHTINGPEILTLEMVALG